MGFKDLFKKKEIITAEQFCDLNPTLKNVRLNGQFVIKDSDRKIYSVETNSYLPENCKTNGAFEIIYDGETKKLYCVEPNCGYISIRFGEQKYKLSTSNIISSTALLTGTVPLVRVLSFK